MWIMLAKVVLWLGALAVCVGMAFKWAAEEDAKRALLADEEHHHEH